jgi:hypothetical protein
MGEGVSLTNRQPSTAQNFFYLSLVFINVGARGSIVVKALCYKPEGRGFETR